MDAVLAPLVFWPSMQSSAMWAGTYLKCFEKMTIPWQYQSFEQRDAQTGQDVSCLSPACQTCYGTVDFGIQKMADSDEDNSNIERHTFFG